MNETSEAMKSASVKPLRLALANLGCKLNHAEGEAMKHLSAEAGFELVPFDAEADVYVVNSCTVTAEADREGRRLARRARRMGGATARVVIAGCSAQANAEKMLIPEADLLLGNREKLRLPDELAKPLLRNETPEMRFLPSRRALISRASSCLSSAAGRGRTSRCRTAATFPALFARRPSRVERAALWMWPHAWSTPIPFLRADTKSWCSPEFTSAHTAGT